MTLPPQLSKNERRWRTIFIVSAVVSVMVYWVRAVHEPANGDLNLHQEFARRLLAGEYLYRGGMHAGYPPFWALFHIPITLAPLAVSKGLLYPLGIVALLCLFLLLHQLVKPHLQPREGQLFWVIALAAVFASRYLLRDLAELSVNTVLVTLSWLSVYLWTRRRDWLGGAILGLATALKCTPAMFILFLAWKRQWKMVVASLLFVTLFTLSPILMQGPDSYVFHMRTWMDNVWTGFANEDPSVGTLGPERLQNMALRPTLARYLMHLPPDHPGRTQHPLYVDFFDLSAKSAGILIKIIQLAIVVGVLWWWREPVNSRDDPRLLWELAGASLLLLLYSPITWGQHCVSVVPAFYLVSSLLLVRGDLQRWMWGVLVAWVLFILVLNYEVVRKSMDWLLQSYHFETFCIIGLLAIMVSCSRQTRFCPNETVQLTAKLQAESRSKSTYVRGTVSS